MTITQCGIITNQDKKELVQHGTIAFPIACYADDFAEITIPWHWHEEFEIALVTEGNPTFHLENAKYELHPGEGIFVNSEALHAMDDLSIAPGSLISAVFHPRFISGNIDSLFHQQLIHPLIKDSSLRYVILRPDVPWQKRFLDAFKTAWEAISEETEDYENEARYQLTKALRILNQNFPTIIKPLSEQEKTDANRIRTMLEYIEEHFGEDLTIDQIAVRASISGSSCLRCFNQTLGISPIQYVKQLRLEKAAELLRSTSFSVKDIAFDCGFNDVSYFTKSFREKKGCTPREYRRNQNKSELNANNFENSLNTN